MNTEPRVITVSGISVQVVRKAIKNLHLGVYPPHGRVRVAAPLLVSDHSVRLAVIGKLGWIRRRQAGFNGQLRESRREMVSGESHYVWGRRYRLNVMEYAGKSSVRVRNNRTLDLHVRPRTTREGREAALYRWYRQLLRDQIPKLIAKWEPLIQADVADWGIKKMKTRWGTCNQAARRIWLNLELAKTNILPGVHRGARDGSFAGAAPQRSVYGAYGPIHAAVAHVSRPVKPSPVEP